MFRSSPAPRGGRALPCEHPPAGTPGRSAGSTPGSDGRGARGRDPRRLPRELHDQGDSPGKRLDGGGRGLLPGPPRPRAEPGRGTLRPGPRRRPRPRAVAGVRGGRPGRRPRHLPPAARRRGRPARPRARPPRRRDRAAPLSWPGCAGGERPPLAARAGRGRRAVRPLPGGQEAAVPRRSHQRSSAGPERSSGG